MGERGSPQSTWISLGARFEARARARVHLRHADPVLARLIDERPRFNPRAWLEDLPPMDLFGALIFQVAGQQLSVAATRGILRRLQAHFDGRLPSRRELLAMPVRELRAVGLSRRKIATLRDIATRITEGRLNERALRKLSDEEVEAQLTEISGIGPWTVHGALIIAFDRDDVVLPGDLALRKIIQRIYRLDHLPTPDEVLAIAEPWRPHRSLATAYLFAAAYEPVT